jgi:hypothetical protein
MERKVPGFSAKGTFQPSLFSREEKQAWFKDLPELEQQNCRCLLYGPASDVYKFGTGEMRRLAARGERKYMPPDYEELCQAQNDAEEQQRLKEFNTRYGCIQHLDVQAVPTTLLYPYAVYQPTPPPSVTDLGRLKRWKARQYEKEPFFANKTVLAARKVTVPKGLESVQDLPESGAFLKSLLAKSPEEQAGYRKNLEQRYQAFREYLASQQTRRT